MRSIRDLMRRDLVALEPYPPPLPLESIECEIGRPIVKLDANENPYGPSPLVAEALARCRPERYPDADCTELRQELAAYLGVEPPNVVCSAGGDEMLDLLLRLFLEPGDSVIDCPPSFVMYPLATLYNRGSLVNVPRRTDFGVDVAGVENALDDRTKVIFVCSPNNPTGNPTPVADILRLLNSGRIVVLDEAYAEFAGYSHATLVTEYSNLVVLRTMSKWAGLAGLRLGYAIVDPSVTEEMAKIKSPYNVGLAAQVGGIASLRDKEYLMRNVRRLVQERERLYGLLQDLPYGRVYPSETNFLCWSTDYSESGVRADELRMALVRRGVLARAFNTPIEALRVSIGTPDESDIFLDALRDAYGELAG